MIRGILKTSMILTRNLIPLTIIQKPSKLNSLRGIMLSSYFSEAKDSLISQISSGLPQNQLDSVLVQIDRLEMNEKEEVLIQMYLAIAKARLSSQTLSNINYNNMIKQFQTKPIYVKSLGLRFEHLASDFLIKIRNKQIINEEASKYLLEMDDLKNKGFSAAKNFSELESFVMVLPFVRLQMAAQINYITYMKEGQERVIGLTEAMDFFYGTSLKNLNSTLEGVMKFMQDEKSKDSQFNRLVMSICLVFCENTLLWFQTANNLFNFGGVAALFKDHLQTYMTLSKIAVDTWEQVEHLHPAASYMIHLQKKRLAAEYYLQKMKQREQKSSEQTLQQLKTKFNQQFQDLYCNLRDKYLVKTAHISEIMSIHMQLVNFMSEIFQQLQLPPEQIEKRLNEQQQVICSIVANEMLRKKFQIYLESYIKRYLIERGNAEIRKLLPFDKRI